MAASHVYPKRGVATRVRFQFFVASTGAPFTGTLTALAAAVSLDDASALASVNTPVQNGTRSYAYLDLTATEMDATAIVVEPSCSNSGVYAAMVEIVTGGLTEMVDEMEADGGTLSDLRARWFNKRDDDGYTMRVYETDNVTIKWRATLEYTNAVMTIGRLA